MRQLKKLIREVPDFPRPGILFYDITTLLKDPIGFQVLVKEMVGGCKNFRPDVVLGIEARGFLFGPILAAHLETGFIPVRKAGKLPAETISVEYDLEYGQDSLNLHKDAIKPGERVLIVDDLLATGGTAAASCQLVEKLGGTVAGLAFIVELTFLKGREKLSGSGVFSVLQYDE